MEAGSPASLACEKGHMTASGKKPKAEGSRRWFEQGIAALQRTFPDVPEVYACPLCLMGYDDPEALSVEDVPPKSVDLHKVQQHCRPCVGCSHPTRSGPNRNRERHA